jgi:hypothetical protein
VFFNRLGEIRSDYLWRSSAKTGAGKFRLLRTLQSA